MRGSKTGVFVGASASESSDSWSADPSAATGFTMIGCQRGMFSNRLSYFFDFKGQYLQMTFDLILLAVVSTMKSW